MNPLSVVLGLVIAISGHLQSGSLVSETAAEKSRSLYLRAVAAWERNMLSEAKRLAGLSLESNPRNRQASKLLEVMGVSIALAPSDSLEALVDVEPGGWAFVERSARIDSFPDYLHFSSPTDAGAPSYALLDLSFPQATVQWEVEFRARFGLPGTLPTGVEFVKASRMLLELSCDGIRAQVRAAGIPLWTGTSPTGWVNFRFEWREGRLEFSVDGKRMATAEFAGVPNKLLLGSRSTRSGKQTEGYFELKEYAYQVRDDR